MKMDGFAFGTTNWADVERTEHNGETGIYTSGNLKLDEHEQCPQY